MKNDKPMGVLTVIPVSQIRNKQLKRFRGKNVAKLQQNKNGNILQFPPCCGRMYAWFTDYKKTFRLYASGARLQKSLPESELPAVTLQVYPFSPCKDKIELSLIDENSTRTIASKMLGRSFFVAIFREVRKNSPARNPRRGA